MKEEDEYLHGFVSVDDEDESPLSSSTSSSPLSQRSRSLLFGSGGTRQMLMRGSSSSSSLCSQSSVDSHCSAHSHASNSSYSSNSSSMRSGSGSRRRRRRRRRWSTTSAPSGGHSTSQTGNREERAPTLMPRSAQQQHDGTSTIASPWRSHDAGSQEESVAKMLHGVSFRGGGPFPSAWSAGAAGHSTDDFPRQEEGGKVEPCATSDEGNGSSNSNSIAEGHLSSSVGLSSLTGPSATSSAAEDDHACSAAGGNLLMTEASKSSKKKKKSATNTAGKKKKGIGMNTVIRPVDVRTATSRRGERPHQKSRGGILRHSSDSYGRNNGNNSGEEGEGSNSSDDGTTTSSSSSSSIRSQASGSTLSSLSVQSASRIPKTYRHNQSRLLSTDPGLSSSSSSSPGSTDTDDADDSINATGAAERRGSWGHMTHHAVYHKEVHDNGGYTSSSTLDSSPYYHDFHVPMPTSDSPHLNRTMFGTTSSSSSRANTFTTRSTMYQQLQTTARHMRQGWKPFLQTPSGHILTKPDYAAIDSEDRPLSRSGSFDTFSVSSLPTIQTFGNVSAASGSAKTTSRSTATTADITVSDEVFTYYGSFRGFLAGLSRRFYYAPLCKLLRRPSFPRHVSPTVDRPPLVRDDTPPRQRLVRSIRNGAELVHITAAYQWQRHSKLLMLSVILTAVTYMLSYVPLYESTIHPKVAPAGGNVGDEFRDTEGGGDRNDYSSPSSAGYQRKVAQLGLVDPNNPSSSISATSTTEGGDQTEAIMAGGYYTIPKEYQILMPSSMGGGASPATNLVRLGPLANIAYITEPMRENDVPIFWHISRAGGSTLKHVMGQCLGMVISSDYGSKMNLMAEDHLRVVTADHGGKYVNVDTSTVAGIENARSMGLVESNMADVLVTQYLYQAASLFNVNQKGRLFTIFRDPIERAVSMFHYLQFATWEPTYDPLLSQISLLDYARSERVKHNWMTRLLSDTLDGPLNENHLELAKAVIRQKCLVGLLSRKGETVERFKEAFGWHEKYPEFEQSVTEEERKLEMTKAEECADKLLHMDWPNKHRHATVDDVQSQEYAQLYEVNRYDIELHKYAERIFDEQSVLFLPPNGVFFRESQRK